MLRHPNTNLTLYIQIPAEKVFLGMFWGGTSTFSVSFWMSRVKNVAFLFGGPFFSAKIWIFQSTFPFPPFLWRSDWKRWLLALMACWDDLQPPNSDGCGQFWRQKPCLVLVSQNRWCISPHILWHIFQECVNSNFDTSYISHQQRSTCRIIPSKMDGFVSFCCQEPATTTSKTGCLGNQPPFPSISHNILVKIVHQQQMTRTFFEVYVSDS